MLKESMLNLILYLLLLQWR